MKHSDILQRKKVLLSFVMAGILVLLALVWVFQFVLIKDSYRVIRTRMAKNVLANLCQDIDGFDLNAMDKELEGAKLGVQVVDENGNVLVESGSFLSNSLAEMSQERLAGLYRQVEETKGVAWEQVMRFHTVYCQNHVPMEQDYQVLTCAEIAQTDEGEKWMVLMCAVITPSSMEIQELRTQLMWVSLPLLLMVLVVSAFLWRHHKQEQKLITQQLNQVAQGDLSVRLQDDQKLGQAFNAAVDQFSRSEQQQREMLANISHDLRSPLTMIIGYTQMMQDLPQENTPENIQVIQEEAQRLSLLVSDILDLSRMQAGQMKLNLQVFCLTDVLQKTVQRYQKLLGKDYTVTLQQSCRVWVKADELQISRVIYNFINNACRHVGEDKCVLVEQKLDAKKVRVLICDHGEGIPEENLSMIWDRYYRVNKSSAAKKAPGNGLGLCIVKEILQAHHAQYGVESQVGEGSTFWFELDVWDHELVEQKENHE